MAEILVFGTGGLYQKNKDNLMEHNIVAFLDNDPMKEGSILDGKKVYKPEYACKLQFDKIIIMSSFVMEIKSQLIRLGICENKIEVYGVDKTNASQMMASYQVCIKQPIQPKRKKVLHIIENFYTGGSTRLIIDIIENLGHQYEQEVFTLYYRGKEEFCNVNVKVIDIDNKDDVIKKIKDYSPDMIHVHIWESEWYQKVFKVLDDLDNVKVIQNINTPTKPIIRDYVERYIFVSQYVLNEFHKQDGKSMVIYPGSNFDIFSRSMKKDYLPKDTIGMVYRLDYDKLSDESIDVFIRTVQKRPQTQVIIVGGGPRYNQYVEKVKAAGVFDKFIFTGYVAYEELVEWYKKFTIFVAPVWKESFGQVTPFAMHMGIPVVGYDIGAINEIIDNRGLLTGYPDDERLSDIIVDLLDDHDRCESIGANNYCRAKDEFALEKMIEDYEKVYNEIME